MSTSATLVLLAASLFIFGFSMQTRRALPSPPGLKKYPIIDDSLNAPTKLQWVTYAQWSKELGQPYQIRLPQPETFPPERFFKDGEMNTKLNYSIATFGFGRRALPWFGNGYDMDLSSILTVFNITKAMDATGCEIEPKVEYTPTLIRNVVPFKCSIKPHSTEVEKLIRDSDLT